MIDGAADDRIDVFAFEQLAIFVERFNFGARVVLLDEGFRAFDALLPDITDCGLDDVVFTRVRFDVAHMGHALPAHADETDHDTVISADDLAGRWGLALTINGRAENVR